MGGAENSSVIQKFEHVMIMTVRDFLADINNIISSLCVLLHYYVNFVTVPPPPHPKLDITNPPSSGTLIRLYNMASHISYNSDVLHSYCIISFMLPKHLALLSCMNICQPPPP